MHAALHEPYELVEEIARVVRSRAALGMVLDAERRDVQELNALGRPIVEVYVREADSSHPIGPNDRSDSSPHPMTKVTHMVCFPVAEFGNEGTHAVEDETVVMVLRGNLHVAGEKVHYGLIATVMAKRQLLYARAGRKRDELVTQADAKDGDVPQYASCGTSGSRYLLGVTRAIGEEHAVGPHREHATGGRIERYCRDLAAGVDKTQLDAAFFSAVVCNDTKWPRPFKGGTPP